MVGVMPRTEWLLTHYNIVVGSFQSRYDICIYLGATVTDDGWVIMNGKRRGPKYYVDFKREKFGNNAFHSKYEVLKDWANCYLKLPSGYKLYRIIP